MNFVLYANVSVSLTVTEFKLIFVGIPMLNVVTFSVNDTLVAIMWTFMI